MQEILEHLEAHLSIANNALSWRDPQSSDFQILLGTKIYQVHKAQFTNGKGLSNILKSMIETSVGSTPNNDQVDLTSMLPKYTWDHFEHVLDYVYGETITIDDSNALIFAKIASALEIPALGIECIKYLKTSFNEMAKNSFSMTWDRNRASSCVTIDSTGKRATKTSGGRSYNSAVIGTSSKKKFSVEITAAPNGREVMIGFVDGFMYKPDGINYNLAGYFINCDYGSLHSRDGCSGRSYLGHTIPVGSIVEARYDAEAKTISFLVGKKGDMVNHGVAFNNVVVNGDLWPCIDFYEPGAVITLMD